MTDNALFKKLKALIAIRVIFVTLLLGSFFLLQVEYSSFPYPRATSNLIAALYILTIIYSASLGKIKRHDTFAYIQLFIDALAASVLIYLTGGIESRFSFVIPLTVLSASVTLNRKAGYIIATFNSILYGTIIDLQYYRLLPIGFDPMLKEKDFLFNIFVHISAFYLVAFLSGYLSSRLEKTTKELEQTDSNLKELDIFNKELIENIPSGIFTTDTEGITIIFNRAAENITGIDKENVLDKKIDTVFPFLKHIAEAEREENSIIHPDEGEKIVGLTISSLKDVAGARTGFIGIFQDLTQFKKMEREVKQKEKWAAVGELSANIAHEIRNPLASLKGSVEMLGEGRITKEHKERLTEIALKEMNRLNKIITDFLTYSSPRAVELSTFDINVTINDTLELLKNTAPVKHDISIKKNTAEPIFLHADRQKLQQVFWNLGINAIEAMPDGGELFVSAKKSENFIEIIFRDTGVGIPKENTGKIFYPFFTTKEEGTGLGLAIAYRIIEEHNGKINIVGSSGEGTTFKVILPYGTGKT